MGLFRAIHSPAARFSLCLRCCLDLSDPARWPLTSPHMISVCDLWPVWIIKEAWPLGDCIGNVSLMISMSVWGKRAEINSFLSSFGANVYEIHTVVWMVFMLLVYFIIFATLTSWKCLLFGSEMRSDLIHCGFCAAVQNPLWDWWPFHILSPVINGQKPNYFNTTTF